MTPPVPKPEEAPARLLEDFHHLLTEGPAGPVLDLACGRGRNGIYLALKGLEVICCDKSRDALMTARTTALRQGVHIDTWQLDLEKQGTNPLPEDHYGAILVFKYLHRPLVPCMKKALKRNGLLFYETFTKDQPRFGRPKNPDFLLDPGELLSLFDGWQVIHYFEGILQDPQRAVAQLICKKA